VASAQIYNLRRHRVDDYRARYRVWLWVLVVFVVLSIDAVAGLRRLVGAVAALAAGTNFGWRPDACWMAIATLGGALVAIRLGFEIRRCRGAIVSLGLSLLSFALGAIFSLGWIPVQDAIAKQLVVNFGFIGPLLAWMSVMVYARHVCLDALGLFHRRVTQKKQAATLTTASSTPEETDQTDKPHSASPAKQPDRQIRVDAAHGQTPAKPISTAAAQLGGPLKQAMISAATNKSPVGGTSQATATEARHLSKAERKRLRKQGRADDDQD
jgi:hypothetical protein